MREIEKNIEYASLINSAIFNLFRNDEEQEYCHLELDELNKNDNATEFFIGYLKAGTVIFNELTGQDRNNLEFTHILNQLCVQDLLKSNPDLLEKGKEE